MTQQTVHRPKVLFVITAGHAGGAQTHIVDLCSRLRHSFDITVMMGNGEYLPEQVAAMGLRCERNPHLIRAMKPGTDWKAFRHLQRFVKQWQPDIVHAHTAKAGALIRLLRFSIFGKRPFLVYTPHNWSFNPVNDAGNQNFNRLFERYSAFLLNKIICVSDSERKMAERFKVGAASQIAVIHNGVHPVAGAETTHKAEMFTFLWVGRLDTPKTPEVALEAFSGLPDAVRTISRLVVVGTGSRHQDLAARFTDPGIIFRGELSALETRRVMQESHILVLSTNYESFGLVVIEAMSAGLPVICSAVGGLIEVTENGQYAMLVPPNDVEALRAAMIQALGDDPLRQRLSVEGQQRSLDFSVQRMTDEVASLYTRMIG